MIQGPMLRVVSTVTFPFAVLLTLYFLVSGHNNPGGGFIAGVLMSGAIALQYLAYGPEGAPKFLKLPYERIVALGFVVAIGAATAPLLAGYPFLTSFHATVDVPLTGARVEFALAQLFDFGIFLLVAGGVMTAVLALGEEVCNRSRKDYAKVAHRQEETPAGGTNEGRESEAGADGVEPVDEKASRRTKEGGE